MKWTLSLWGRVILGHYAKLSVHKRNVVTIIFYKNRVLF